MICPFFNIANRIHGNWTVEQCKPDCALYDKNNSCCAVFTYLTKDKKEGKTYEKEN